jgi:ABC-type branched-subunit amino acid transport system substrate-binding protein
MEMAVEEINAKGGVGGVPIELICYDTQTAEAEALKAYSRLVERDKVLAVSGPCFSGEFETIAPQLDRMKTVINSYCSAKPGLSDMSIWAFRNTLTSAKNNNQPPPYSGPRAYDIIYSYKHCIEESGVTNNASDLDKDRDRIRGCLAKLKGFPGVAGEITMDEHRDGAGSSAILKVVNGKYVNVAK